MHQCKMGETSNGIREDPVVNLHYLQRSTLFDITAEDGRVVTIERHISPAARFLGFGRPEAARYRIAMILFSSAARCYDLLYLILFLVICPLCSM